MADSEATTTIHMPVFKKRKGTNMRKRAATPPPADSDSSSYSSSEDEAGHKIKRRKRNTGAITASSKSAVTQSELGASIHEASRNGITSANDATKSATWYDESATDALSKKNLLGTTRKTVDSSATGDGTYKGLANATKFIERNADAPSRNIGPIKAPTNIRTITVTDFAPDVCKDYKQTGFCGFGDNCKYLHAREDYKQGWQLDSEWDKFAKGKKVIAGTVVASADRKGDAEDDAADEAFLESIPFKCIICRKDYKDPYVTKCGHYFCFSCAMNRYQKGKDPSCAACGAGTGGVFNVAKNLKKILAKKTDRAAARRAKAIEAGEEVSEEEEDD